jgi:hypothetical protein
MEVVVAKINNTTFDVRSRIARPIEKFLREHQLATTTLLKI